jgi:DNA-directed RNA polymerase specialized sigma24 family protein
MPDQVVAHRLMLMRVARHLLRDDACAEDAVSETLMAALEKPNGYTGRVSVKVWLVGILKHKVVDQIRRHTRECQATFSNAAGSDCGDLHDAEQGDAFEKAGRLGRPAGLPEPPSVHDGPGPVPVNSFTAANTRRDAARLHGGRDQGHLR